MRRKVALAGVVAVVVCAAGVGLAQSGAAGAGAGSDASGGDALAAGFVAPPDSAKPRTWWHWTNGNVTETGITKDLEWMKRVGIGGFQLVDVAQGNGQVVEPKINFGTPEWYHAVLHSAELAKQLDLEMSIFSCAGWSEAGGPWVTQQMAMKRWCGATRRSRAGRRLRANWRSRLRMRGRCGTRRRGLRRGRRIFIGTAWCWRTGRRRRRWGWRR